MNTTFDQDTILFQLINGSQLKTAISGCVYKWQRPVDSGVEDVVINSLPLTTESVQLGTANVNIYVPDLTVKVGGKPQQLPNTKRLGELTKIALPILKQGYGANYGFYVTHQTTIQEAEIKQHYINLRIEFRFHKSIQ